MQSGYFKKACSYDLKKLLFCEKLVLLYMVTNKLTRLSNTLLIHMLLFIALLLKHMKTFVFLQKTQNVKDVCFFLNMNHGFFFSCKWDVISALSIICLPFIYI